MSAARRSLSALLLTLLVLAGACGDDDTEAATVAGDVVEVVLRGPDGNRAWVTGTTDEAEGVDVVVNAMDDVLTVQGTWVRADDPGTTEEGDLVVTC